MNQPWLQNFDPLGNTLLSTLAAAVPVCTLFFFLAVRRTAAWKAALFSFVAAVLVALAVFRMPAIMVAGAVADGLVFGWFRIAWIVVAAVFVYDVSRVDLRRLGPALEHHPLFPRRTNVQVARVEAPDRVRVRIWERGAGETLASGSSACAVAAACVRLGYTDDTLTVCMGGGALRVEICDGWTIRMTGPAVLVYRGTLAASFVTWLGG